jgi:hypothetical protein
LLKSWSCAQSREVVINAAAQSNALRISFLENEMSLRSTSGAAEKMRPRSSRAQEINHN